MRQRSPENVAEEISNLVSEHRARNFYFVDDNFALNPRWILRFCELIIKKQLKINWFIQARINRISINNKTLRSMKRAGCHNILFGVESGSKRILDYYNKNILIEDTIKIFDECHRIGINTHAFLIIGAPIEDKDDLEKTVRLIRRISPDSILISRLTANPGTRLYDELKEEGIINYGDYDESFNSRYPLNLKYLDESDLDFYEKKITRVFFFARLKNRLTHPINKIIFPMIDRFCCSSFL
jgi:radical SAM superfamily enzyme YgiQ (UPF0313 family)